MEIKRFEFSTGEKRRMRFSAALWEAFRIALDSIWSHKLRSVLTLLGIIVGVASVVTVGGAINGFGTYASETISSAFGSNTFRVSRFPLRGVSSEDWDLIVRRNKNITRADFEAVVERCTSCLAVSPMMQRRIEAKRGGQVFYDASVHGVSDGMPKIQSLDLDEGRFFSAFDVRSARPFVVVGADVRDELFGTGDAVGKEIRLGSDKYTVIGVEKRNGSMMGQSMDRNVYIPYTSFMKRYGSRQSIVFQVRAPSDEMLVHTMDEVRQILRIRYKLKPNRDDVFSMMASDAVQEMLGGIINAIALAVIPITMISLVVGGIVVMNIMLVTVTERTVEIGTRKAVGARRSDIMLQFLIESSLLATFGGAIGIMIAYGASELIQSIAGLPMNISIGYIIMALMASGGIGVISGIYPAYKASKLSPVTAIAKE